MTCALSQEPRIQRKLQEIDRSTSVPKAQQRITSHPSILASIHLQMLAFMHAFMHSWVYGFIHSSIHPLIQSIPPDIHESIRPSSTSFHPLPFIHFSLPTSIHPCTHAFVHPLIHLSTQPPLHLQDAMPMRIPLSCRDKHEANALETYNTERAVNSEHESRHHTLSAIWLESFSSSSGGIPEHRQDASPMY